MSGKRSRFDAIMEAVTFAEVGETETAGRLSAEVFRTDAPDRARILAVSGPRAFSPALVEKSIEMADRLHYGVIALSVAAGGFGLLARLRARRRERLLSDAAAAFRARASERGIPFLHAVAAGAPEKAIPHVTRRFRRIAFLLVDPELAPLTRALRVDLPVFSPDRG